MVQLTGDSILHSTTNANGISKPTLNHSLNRTNTPTLKSNSHSPPNTTITAHTSATPIVPNPRSCVTCRRRKVKCDKQHPCSNCKKAHIDCVFPGPGRAVRKPRRTQDNAELIERLKKLEGVVQSLGGLGKDGAGKDRTTVRTTQIKPGDNSPGASPKSTDDAGRKDSAVDQNGAVRTGLERPFGRLEIEKGRSSYIEEPLWTSMAQEVEQIKAALNVSSDDEAASETDSPSPPSASPTSNHQSFIFGLRSENVNLRKLHPPVEQIETYWNLYRDNVDPIIKVLHIPIFTARIMEAKDHLDEVPRGFECMMFAIYYSVATALWPDECRAKLGAEKEELLERYRFACEQAFARAQFLQTDEYIVIQAFVTFLMCLRFHICLRRNNDNRIIWTLTGLIIRMAQTLGLHKDGEQHGLNPFRTEMRRRLWWQICILDARASEDHGCESSLSETMFTTKLPLNVTDDKITQDMTEFPEEMNECTPMTFCLVRYEVASMLKKLSYPSRNGKKDENGLPSAASIEEKEKWVNDSYERIKQRFLTQGDTNTPLNWLVSTVADQVISKANLLLYRPFQRQDGGKSLPPGTRDKLFQMSLHNIETSLKLESEAQKHRWGWIFRTYTQWHAIAFLLSELRWRVKGELVERAWHAVDEAMKRRFSDHFSPAAATPNHTQLRGQMWKPLRRLMVVAKKARAKELAQERQERQALGWAPETHNLDVSDPIMSVDLGVERLYPGGVANTIIPNPATGVDPWGGFSAPAAQGLDWMSPASQGSGAEGSGLADGLADTAMSNSADMLGDNTFGMSDFSGFGQPTEWFMNMDGANSSTPDIATGFAKPQGMIPTAPPADGTIAPDLLTSAQNTVAGKATTTGSNSPPSFGAPTRTDSTSTGKESVDWETWDNLVQEFGMELDQNTATTLPGMEGSSFGGFGMGAMGVGQQGMDSLTQIQNTMAGSYNDQFGGWSQWY